MEYAKTEWLRIRRAIFIPKKHNRLVKNLADVMSLMEGNNSCYVLKLAVGLTHHHTSQLDIGGCT